MHDNQELKDDLQKSQDRLGLIICVHLVDDRSQLGDSDNLKHINDSKWTSGKELINWQWWQEINQEPSKEVVSDNLFLLRDFISFLVVVWGVKTKDDIDDEEDVGGLINYYVTDCVSKCVVNLIET